MKEFNVNNELKSINKKKINKRSIVISLVCLLVLTIVGVSYALYKTDEKTIVFVNSKVGEFNSKDIILAVLVDGVKQDNFPAKGSGYDFIGVSCDNGSTGTWDSSAWTLTMAFSGPDSCTVSFEKSKGSTAEVFMNNLLASAPSQVIKDPYNNIRFYGATPNNYVDFNGEKWRIIGTFNVVNPDTGATETRLKIMRDASIGNYSWDSSASGVNSGYGVNEWSQADIMTTLNSGAYWNRTSGTCYNGSNNSTTTCDFSSNGLTAEAKALISKARWNTGTLTGDFGSLYSSYKGSQFYNDERSSANGKQCSSGTYCNDTVSRTTTWDGYVGLMYPSDYVYATSGGTTNNREACINSVTYNWDSGALKTDCAQTSWIFNSAYQWTLTPVPYSSLSSSVFFVSSAGFVDSGSAYGTVGVRPVVYLSSNVKITGGTGTSADSYKLGA